MTYSAIILFGIIMTFCYWHGWRFDIGTKDKGFYFSMKSYSIKRFFKKFNQEGKL
jgi:hypothetical protein